MIIDLIACLIIVYGLYQGYSSGLIKTVFATVSIIVAIVAALKLSPIVIRGLQNNIDFSPAILFVLGFVLTFILVLILIRFIGKKLENVFVDLKLNSLNKVAGAALLGFFYAILISFGVLFLDKISLISEGQKSSSFTYPILKPLPSVSQSIGRSLEPVFKDFWNAFISTMDDIKAKGDEIQGQNMESGD